MDLKLQIYLVLFAICIYITSNLNICGLLTFLHDTLPQCLGYQDADVGNWV